MDKNDNNYILPLEVNKSLQNKNIIINFYYHISTEHINVSVNHNCKAFSAAVKIDFNNFAKSVNQLDKTLGPHDIDKDIILDIKNNIYDNYPLIWKTAQKYKQQKQQKREQNEDGTSKKDKREITVFKYSQMGKDDLYESVFIENRLPFFVKYNNLTRQFEKIALIEETTRILTPPTLEECPYMPYEFETLEEMNSYSKFIDDNDIDLDYLYKKGFEIIAKFNDQSGPKLRLVAINLVLSYFCDRFPTTHYLYPVGANGGGKSSIADTFKSCAYRAVTMTDPTAPNLFRLLGIVEPAQCTIILEEADKIDKLPELMAVLKTGYSYYGIVPKINPYTLKQEFYFTFCPKVIVSERSLNQSIAKGVNSRTLPINCFKGVAKHDIKEVLNPTNTGGHRNKRLLHEIIDYRKLLLVYRLKHFKDPIPDLDVGVEGRDKELVKPAIQLFYGCKCLKEVIETLQEFLNIKNEKKKSSIESVLLPIISTLIKFRGNELPSKSIWEEIIQEIPGKLDEKKPNEYHTEDYGTIYRTTVSTIIGDSFGATVKHTKKGNVLIFDTETIQKLIQEDKTRITVSEQEEDQDQDQEKDEGVNRVKAADRGGSTNSNNIEESEEGDKTIQGIRLSPNGQIHYNKNVDNEEGYAI